MLSSILLNLILLIFIYHSESLNILSMNNMPNSNRNVNKIQKLKDELLLLTSKTVVNNGIDATIEQRNDINTCVQQLEKSNPTKRPALASSLLKGRWKMIYTDIPIAPSNGKLGPFIGKVYQDLVPATSKNTKDGYIKNILDLSSIINGELCAIQSIYSDDTWRIDFDYVENKFFGIPFQKKEFPPIGTEGSQTRFWKLQYLDEDLRILRAGILPNKSNNAKLRTENEDYLFITIKE